MYICLWLFIKLGKALCIALAYKERKENLHTNYATQKYRLNKAAQNKIPQKRPLSAFILIGKKKRRVIPS